jgi:hypothetical protein
MRANGLAKCHPAGATPRNLPSTTLTVCAWPPGGQWNSAMDAKRPKSLGLRTSNSAVARESIEDAIGLTKELLMPAVSRCACSGGASMAASRLLPHVARRSVYMTFHIHDGTRCRRRLDCWNFETASGLPSEVSDIKTGQRIRTKLVLVSDGNTLAEQ